MRGEDFVKIILVIIGVIVWLISSALKANKKNKEKLLNLKRDKLLDKSDDINQYPTTYKDLTNKPQYTHEVATKKTYTYAGETYEIENINNVPETKEMKKESLISKGDKTEIEKQILKKEQIAKDALRKEYLKKQELIEHEYNLKTSGKSATDLFGVQESDIQIDLDFTTENILKGFIFKEILDRRGRNR